MSKQLNDIDKKEVTLLGGRLAYYGHYEGDDLVIDGITELGNWSISELHKATGSNVVGACDFNPINKLLKTKEIHE